MKSKHIILSKIHTCRRLVVFSFFFCTLALCQQVRAAYLENVPITLTQPDGTVINCFATGDEYYNWVHDQDGYTIVQNPTTGYYCYAELRGDELVASSYIVGLTNPKNTALKSRLNISVDKIVKKRNEIINDLQDETKFPIEEIAENVIIGTLNNIVIYIRFADQVEFPAEQGKYTDMFNGSGNSMKNYFQEISYNKLTINSYFYPNNNGSVILSYQDPQVRNYYCPYNATTNPIGFTNENKNFRRFTLLKNAIEYIKSQIPNNLNLDCNNDGFVDNISFIVRGSSGGSQDILWPHKAGFYMGDIHGKKTWNYVLYTEMGIDGDKTGLLCHEMGHSLGAPDLYHYADNIYPVGSWDIMGRTVNPPTYMSVYLRYKYIPWIDSIVTIHKIGSYTILPSSSSCVNNAYKILLDGTSEYLIVEYRKKVGIFEENINDNGLIVYRINELYHGIGNAQGSGPGGVRDEVYIFCPDGTVSSQGFLSKATFSETLNRSRFGKLTNPYCFTSDGNRQDVYFKNIKENPDGTLSFDFSYCGDDDRLFANTSSLPGNTNVSGSIRTTGAVIVKATDNVVFQATDYVELGAGFEVKEGGTLTVSVTGCK